MGLRILLVSFLVVAAARAAEPDPNAKVRALFDSGVTHYNLAEYKEALADFKEAYRLRHDPVFLYNIAQAYRQLGDPDGAVRAYRAYLREAPAAPNRDEVEKLIADQERELREHHALQTPSSVLTPTPEATPAPPPPPAERIIVTPAPAPPPPAPVVVVTPKPATPPPAATEKKASHISPWWYVGAAAAVVVVGGAVALGVAASGGNSAPTTDAGTYNASFK